MTPSRPKSPSHESDGQPPRLLVVGADPARRAHFAAQLAEAGRVRIIEAATVEQGLAAAEEFDLAMGLVDVDPPAVDGIRLATMIRRHLRAKWTPLIFVLGDEADPDYVKRCYRVGAADIMRRNAPDPQALVQKARVYLHLFEHRMELVSEVSHVKGENRELIEENREFLRLHKHLRHQATHDSLTGLPNRILFADRLVSAARRARRNREPLAVVVMDMDRFKEVNDQHGHAAGDDVLVEVSRRLSSALRGTDTVARLGGDEFGILLEALDTPKSVAIVAEQLRRALSKPVKVASRLRGGTVDVKVGASFGVALLPDRDMPLQELINRADQMMYVAKQKGDSVCIDDPERRKRSDAKVKPLRERRNSPVAGDDTPVETKRGEDIPAFLRREPAKPVRHK